MQPAKIDDASKLRPDESASDPAPECGWFASSHELQQGLVVTDVDHRLLAAWLFGQDALEADMDSSAARPDPLQPSGHLGDGPGQAGEGLANAEHPGTVAAVECPPQTRLEAAAGEPCPVRCIRDVAGTSG